MPCTPDRSLLFIHIPKTGGSSIEKALGIDGPWQIENKEILFGLIQSPDLLIKNWKSAFLQHLTWQEIQQNWDFGGALCFTAVRNPWARFASVYTNTDTHLKQTAAAVGINLENLEFDQFVEITNGFEHAHLASQFSYIHSSNYQNKEIRILHTENLENEFQQITKHLGKFVALPWVHTSKQKIPFQQLYSEASWRIIAERYAEDIEVFGYADKLHFLN